MLGQGCLMWFLQLLAVFSLAASVFFPGSPSCYLLSSSGSPTAPCPFPWDTKLPPAPWKAPVGAGSCQHSPLKPFSGLLKTCSGGSVPGKQIPFLVFLSFCLIQDEILGVVCRIAFMSMLAVLSGHLKPPRFRQKMHHFPECCQ